MFSTRAIAAPRRPKRSLLFGLIDESDFGNGEDLVGCTFAPLEVLLTGVFPTLVLMLVWRWCFTQKSTTNSLKAIQVAAQLAIFYL